MYIPAKHIPNVKMSIQSLYIMTKDMYEDYLGALGDNHEDVVRAKTEMDSLRDTFIALFNEEPATK